MNNTWTPYMTEEMLDVVADLSIDYMKEEFLFCHKNYLKAKQAGSIALPATSHTGEPVKHAARSEMDAIATYWEIRRDLIKKWLPKEWIWEHDVSHNVFRSIR